MNAGRELDAMVAEKVMGETDYEHGELGEDSSGDPYCSRCRMSGSWGDQIFSDERCIPAYSASIAAAWTIVEKLGNWHGFDFMVAKMEAGNGHPSYWEAGWYEPSHEGPERRVVVEAETAPLAICLAALEAVDLEIHA